MTVPRPRRGSALERKLLTTVLRTVHDYGLITPGDRVLCGL